MKAEQRIRIQAMLSDLRRDIQNEVAERDVQPLTGHNVRTWLGHISAEIDALAHVCQVLLEEVDA